MEMGFHSPKQKILITDDAPANIKVLARALRSDYQVVAATSGDEALRIVFSDHPPDLVLLDIMMPGMNGYEVFARLKEDERARHIPVIFVTAVDSAEDESRGIEMGAADYITKPFNMPVVKTRIDNHLELKRYRDMLDRLARLDGLTGIPNRTAFNQTLNLEWRRAVRCDSSLALIIIELDRFKRIIQDHGNLIADQYLKQIGQALAACARRAADFVTRFDNHSFAALLPDVNPEQAVLLAERMQQRISRIKLEDDEHTPITATFGIAAVRPAMETDPTALVEAAETALRKGIDAGGDRIQSLDDSLT